MVVKIGFDTEEKGPFEVKDQQMRVQVTNRIRQVTNRTRRKIGYSAGVNLKIGTDGVFALFVAANRGHASCVEVLLGVGATVDMERKTLSGRGRTSLSVAAEQGFDACVDLLVRAYADQRGPELS